MTSNVLFLLSDEHARSALGVYGHPVVKTPTLDRLAANGMVFAWLHPLADLHPRPGKSRHRATRIRTPVLVFGATVSRTSPKLDAPTTPEGSHVRFGRQAPFSVD